MSTKKEEAEEKSKYINANILAKGYNPEELSNFIMNKLSRRIESLSLDELKNMVELFKDQSLEDTYLNLDINEEKKTKTSSKECNPLYTPTKYTNIKTSIQQDNLLLQLEKEKKNISIKISEPKKEKSSGFFSKAVFSYKIECPEIKTNVRRTYADFEWLKLQLSVYYTFRFVPPVLKETNFIQMDIISKQDSEEVAELAKIKYLNFYMNSLIKKKIFRTSPILYEFLELNDKDFKDYKDLLNKYKFDLALSLENLKTLKGEINFELKPSDIQNADNFNKKYNNLSEIYNKLDKSILNISNDFNNLELHMKDVSEQYFKLSKELNDVNSATQMKNIYGKLNKIFTSWSISYNRQYTFFKNEFRNVFNYMNLELQEMNNIHKQYLTYKKEYEDFSGKVNKKKEELFNQKDTSKWSVEPGTEDQIPKYINNKKVAFEKMLYEETNLVAQEKRLVACNIYQLFKQYDKLMKNQNDRIEKYFENLKQNNQTIVGDAFNLIKLFSIQKDEE